MTLTEILRPYIAACFTGIWVESHEHQDALNEIAQLCRQEEWRLAVWDLEQGLRLGMGQAVAASSAIDPLAAVRAVGSLAPAAPPNEQPAESQTSSILVLVNFHRFLQSAEIVQALCPTVDRRQADRRTFLVILSPVVQIPIELEKLFVVDRASASRPPSNWPRSPAGSPPKPESCQRARSGAAPGRGGGPDPL